MTTAAPSLFDRFEADEVQGGTFTHRDHVEVAYEMLKRYDFAEAVARTSKGLRSIARRAGAPGKFHVTITVAFMSIVAERMSGQAPGSFESFLEVNGDLLRRDLLDQIYPRERLSSDTARMTFILPTPAL